MRRPLPVGFLALLAIGACNSRAPSGPPSDDRLDGAGSNARSTEDAPSMPPSRSAIDGADAALEDASAEDATRIGDTTLAEANVADGARSDATLSETASTDDATPDTAAEAPEASAPDGGPGDATADAGSAPADAAGQTDAGKASPDDDAADAPTFQATTTDAGAYVFTSGDLSLEVDPRVGGRVVSFALGGQNVLTGPDANPTNYGSTFWTSPQSDWSWPPPPEIDNQPYAATLDAGALTLEGPVNSALSVAVTKVFSLDAARGLVSITYSIRNAGAAARSLAPWEVTRVGSSGLMFFPTGQWAYSADGGPPLSAEESSGVTWFDADASSITANTKFFADAARGWIAQASGGLVFVKKFVDPPFGSQAPGEAPIEMFVSGDRAYVELEEQGAYQPIAARSSVAWTVRWFLRKLPVTVDAGLGSASLVAFVDAL